MPTEKGSHQSDQGRHGLPTVVVTAAELQVEQQGVVGHQVEAICIHQGLAVQVLTGLKAW